MAIDREFLDRLDREIANLKERIAKHQATESGQPDPGATEARLKQLEDMREMIIAQSTGG